jgi:hypothetical protein
VKVCVHLVVIACDGYPSRAPFKLNMFPAFNKAKMSLLLLFPFHPWL